MSVKSKRTTTPPSSNLVYLDIIYLSIDNRNYVLFHTFIVHHLVNKSHRTFVPKFQLNPKSHVFFASNDNL